MKQDDPYGKFDESERILRDELAIDRTVLANERTVLAYSRTSLTLVIAGLSFWNFATGAWLGWIGLVFIPVGLLIGILGLVRYLRMRQIIQKIRYNPN